MDFTKLYALDIETDSGAVPVDPDIPAGLDPRSAAVTSVAVLGQDAAVSFDDADETRLLRSLAVWLASGSGVIVTWNGANFDLPYLVTRAEALGVDLGIVLRPADPSRPPRYSALPGHTGGYFARVGARAHIDIAYLWRDWAEAHGVPWALKPVATAHGIDVIEVDRARVSELSITERMAYNLSDVNATLRLAELNDPTLLAAAVDPLP